MKYSGKQINKAGDKLRNFSELMKEEKEFESCMDILSFWRFTHEEPLEMASLELQKVASKKDKSVIFAKRLKRYISIVKKLQRFKSMKLRNMQDIGGCRAILRDERKLRKTVKELKKLPVFKFPGSKFKTKDYIKNPKPDGYRSFHIIGVFPDETGQERKIEVQLRTRIQHCWATALEIVDLFTDQALKSNQGNIVWEKFFLHLGEQFAVMDSIHLFHNLSKTNQAIQYHKKLNKYSDLKTNCKITKHFFDQLEVFEKMNAFANSLKFIDKRIGNKPTNGYVLLKINTSEHSLLSRIFDETETEDAKKEYIEAEKETAGKKDRIVALVSTTAVGGIKEAYPNYFADSTDFLKLLAIVVAVGRRLESEANGTSIP